jgi:hypothetical protein
VTISYNVREKWLTFIDPAVSRSSKEMRAHILRLTLSLFVAAALLSGCHRDYRGYPPLNTDGYRYSAGAAVVGPEQDTLRVAVVVVNESNQHRMLPLSHCPVWASVVQARVTASGRNWNSEVYEQRQHVVPRDSTGKPRLEGCVASLLVRTFPPGDTETSVLKVPVRQILGDSLPSGRYRVTARLMGSGGDGRKLDAGDVFLCNCEVRATNLRTAVK